MIDTLPPFMAPVPTPWEAAMALHNATLPWIKSAKVELDRDPTTNVGGLHEKIARVRELSNQVRDTLFDVLTIRRALKTEADDTAGAYEKSLTSLGSQKVDDETFKKMKSKEERELYLRGSIPSIYDAKRVAEGHLDEWDQFIKQVNVIYYSLSNTREDIGAQINVLKQQMFKGEVKPGQELKALTGLPLLSDLLSSDHSAGANAGVTLPSISNISNTPSALVGDRPFQQAAPDGTVSW